MAVAEDKDKNVYHNFYKLFYDHFPSALGTEDTYTFDREDIFFDREDIFFDSE